MNKDYYRIDNDNIAEIRFLPMDKKSEFETYEAEYKKKIFEISFKTDL